MDIGVRSAMVLDTISFKRLPPEDEALREPIRALIAQLLPEVPLEERVRSWTACDVQFSRALGQAGYLGLTIPTAYGGGGRGPFSRFVVTEELLVAGAPVAAHWVSDRQSALQILRYGTEAQRQSYLPRICRGEIFFCIGMSEPGAGSDLASVRTRASKVKDGWRLNGQKTWTTSAAVCDYMIALVRSSGGPDDRHKGLSQMIVDLKAPGVVIRPIPDLTGNAHFAEVFFQDVLLGEDMLIGTEGEGWQQVNAELALERSGPERIFSTVVLLDAWIRHLRECGRCDEGTCRLVGELMAQLATLRALSIAVTARLAEGENPALEAALVKDLGTTFEQAIPDLIADDLGSRPDDAVDKGLLSALIFATEVAPSFSLRGGTREVLRGIVARGLGT